MDTECAQRCTIAIGVHQSHDDCRCQLASAAAKLCTPLEFKFAIHMADVHVCISAAAASCHGQTDSAVRQLSSLKLQMACSS